MSVLAQEGETKEGCFSVSLGQFIPLSAETNVHNLYCTNPKQHHKYYVAVETDSVRPCLHLTFLK